MKYSRLFFATVFCTVLFFANANAQNSKSSGSGLSSSRNTTYTMALGLRGGFEGGITFKYFFNSPKALEFLLSRGWGYGGFRLTGLYEIHKGFSGASGLDLYYGFGAHVGNFDGAYYGYYGYYNGGYYDSHGHWHPTGYRRYYTTIGVDGILGIEYQFSDLPFNVSLDIKPYIDLYGYGSRFVDGALSVRYNIK